MNSTAHPPPAPSSLPKRQYNAFKKLFDHAYNEWSRGRTIESELAEKITSKPISVDDFQKLTTERQLARFVALIDGKIRFDELPKKPHGELAHFLAMTLSRQFDEGGVGAILIGCSDNDTNLGQSLKRPDASFKIADTLLPNPLPTWLMLLPNNSPYPNVVVEIAVNNEGPNQLIDDARRYFGANTSIRVWIGVKVWLQGRKFWVGWGERAAGGAGVVIHTNMSFPPNHHSIDNAVNVVYHIPMNTVYGPGVPIPQTNAATLDIDTDAVRRIILQCGI